MARRLQRFTSVDAQGYAHGVSVAFRVAAIATLVAVASFSLVIFMAFGAGCPGGESCPMTAGRIAMGGGLILALILTLGAVAVGAAALVRAIVLLSLALRDRSRPG